MQRDLAIRDMRKLRSLAQKWLDDLNAATNYDEARTAWVEYVKQIASIYEKLKAGCQGDPSLEGWYHRKLRERKADPYQNYLHHARNAEQHGVQGSNLHLMSFRVIKGVVYDIKFYDDGSIRYTLGSPGFEVEWASPKLTLKQVVDRNVSYLPPVADPEKNAGLAAATDVASAGLVGIDELIDEAAKRLSAQ